HQTDDRQTEVSHKKAQKAASGLLIRLCLFAVLIGQPHLATAQTTQRASISIDARKVENHISPLLYGQFLEFMFEGVKGGLHAELISNRSFAARRRRRRRNRASRNLPAAHPGKIRSRISRLLLAQDYGLRRQRHR